MLASRKNSIIKSKENLKFVEISRKNLEHLAKRLNLNPPLDWTFEYIIFIGPQTRLHYKTVAEDLGLDPENLSEKQVQAFIEAKYKNAGHLVNIGGKSLITGTSMTLSNEEGERFAALAGTAKKKALDQATQKLLQEIYGQTWNFDLDI